MCIRADTGFVCIIFNWTAYSVCPELFEVISDKSCFTVLHLIIKPANITSVGCMFKTNAFPSFYSLLLSLFLSAYPPNCCFHPCSNQLDSQVSTFSFSSNCLSPQAQFIACTCLTNMFLNWFSSGHHIFPPFHPMPRDGLLLWESLYRWERAKKKMEVITVGLFDTFDSWIIQSVRGIRVKTP